MTQYSDYGTVPSQIIQVIANKISLLDFYFVMRTGEYEYTAQIYRPATKQTDQYVFTRSSSSYSSQYEVVHTVTDWSVTFTNEYYVYSNCGYGQAIDLPVTDLATAHSSVILSCALMLAIVFKGVLFRCLRRK